MTNEITLEGEEYISSKRASELSGYAQDYIGQLARVAAIDAKRIGGLWYVSLDSLDAYKNRADEYKPEPPKRERRGPELDASITFDGRHYVSAAHAAKTTGYHQDYVGQLARSGKIASRQIGNRWYVDHKGLIAHKAEKDALLGNVQAQSVGIYAAPATLNTTNSYDEPYFTYTPESNQLMPELVTIRRGVIVPPRGSNITEYEPNTGRVRINIRHAGEREAGYENSPGAIPGKTRRALVIPGIAVVSATLIILIIFGIGAVSPKPIVSYTFNILYEERQSIGRMLAASAAYSIDAATEWIETLLGTELTYLRYH